jgi:hypothetical protein
MNLNEMKQIIDCSQITLRKGVFTFRQGYFYTFGKTSKIFLNEVKKRLDDHGVKYKIIDSGNKFTSFKGGEPVSKQSHWWVKLEVL